MTPEPKKIKKDVPSPGDGKKLDGTLERKNPNARHAASKQATDPAKQMAARASRSTGAKTAQPAADQLPAPPSPARKFEKTMVIPELQQDDLVPKHKPQAAKADFSKTAVIPELADEPIAGPTPEPTTPAPVPTVKKDPGETAPGEREPRWRRQQPLPSRSSNSGVWWWLLLAIIIVAIFFLRKSF